MDHEKFEELQAIIHKAGMVGRPEYYSGRGATTADLNKKHLEAIFQGIVKEFGDVAGANFILMVSDIDVLSATQFLNSLYNLFWNNWEWDSKCMGERVAINGRGSAFGTFASVLRSRDRDDTQAIKSSFLPSHGVKPRCIYREGWTVHELY